MVVTDAVSDIVSPPACLGRQTRLQTADGSILASCWRTGKLEPLNWLKRTLFITVIGQDKKGIVARISGLLYEAGVNIEDISQGIMEGYFVMTMAVDMRDANPDLETLSAELRTWNFTLRPFCLSLGVRFCRFLRTAGLPTRPHADPARLRVRSGVRRRGDLVGADPWAGRGRRGPVTLRDLWSWRQETVVQAIRPVWIRAWMS